MSPPAADTQQKSRPRAAFFTLGHQARMQPLLRRLGSGFGGFSSCVDSGFGSISSASGGGVSSSTGSGFNSASHGRSSGSIGRSSSRCSFNGCWCWGSSRCWRLNRCFFFFAASGQSNGGQQAGDQDGFFHENFQWMCTKRSKTLEPTKKKPERLFELGRSSLTPICECVSRLERNHTTEKSTVFTLPTFFFFSQKNVVKKGI